MKIKKLFLLFTFGLTLGLLSPVIANAISLPSDIGGSGLPGIEDTYQVDPIDPSPDYDEGYHYCEGARHVYYHTNTSTDSRDNEIWGIVHSFAIVLDTNYAGGTPASNDFWENVKTTTLLCTDGDSTYVNCGFDKDTITPGTEIWSTSGGRWSGVSITYDTLDWIEGNPRGLVWKYGTNDPTDKNIKPWIASGSSKLEAVSFDLEDFDTAQTVTTESWTKMEFYTFHDDGSYDHIYTDDVDPDGDGDDDETGVDPDGDYIYWYGLNARIRSIFPACLPEITCADLSISPSSLSVDDVFSNTNFALTATNNEGTDITDEVEFTYEAFQYDGSASTGDIRYGPVGALNGNSSVSTSDDTIEYRNSLPGDRLTAYVSDYEGVNYGGTGICEVEVEFPYCTDLNITDPSSSVFFTAGNVDIPIEIEAEASTGEDWPYSVDYNSTDAAATFDGNFSPYTTTDWTVDSYQSSVSASVWTELDDENGDGISDDVANLCSDSFSYGIVPTCDYLEITVPATQPLTCEEMTAGNVQITWESYMTSGAPSTGPWQVSSDNSAGTFSLTSGGAVVGTGTYLSAVSTLYYNGADGDTIQVVDMAYPICVDTLESEPCTVEAPICEDLTLSDPYIKNPDGTTTTIDLDTADLEILYSETTICWDYTVTVSDAGYIGRIVADGYTDNTMSAHNGTLALTVNETASGNVGNPATVPVTGFTTYTGTLCWENFEAGNYLSIFMLGDRLLCSDNEELPLPPAEAPVCVGLQMSPDTYVMGATDLDAGNIPITIDVQGGDSTWTGTLIVEHTGVGALFYSDGSPSTATDGHLEIPVSGTSYSVTVFYRNGREGDTVTSYVQGEENPCSDSFTITKPGVGLFCEDLTLSPDSLVMEPDAEDAGTINGTVVVTGSDSAWTGTLIISKSGAGQLHYRDGSDSTESDGHLEMSVAGISSTVTFTYTGGEAGDTVTAYIEGESNLCSDAFTITQGVEGEICEDIDFSEDVIQVDADCEDVPGIEICVERDNDDERTIEICYENQDGSEGEFEYEGHIYEGCAEITIEFGPGETSQCFDITFYEVCEGADITVRENGEICAEIPVETLLEELEMGTFNKFIYTFNFSSEKNSYSDEGVFFSHDEDRAFYTLQYEPTGDEEDITFTDEMWGSDLEGQKGDGEDSGGYVSLAESYTELTKGESGTYDYESIENFGFGTHPYATDSEGDALLLEENSTDIANYIESTFNEGNFMTFIPYVKISGAESVLIPECEYDGDGDLETETVCYDPEYSPEEDEKVVIENAGDVYETYGASAAIRIRYVGVIDSRLNCDDTGDECLTEEFENSASVEVYDSLDSLTDTARLVVLCSYLMTQNAGDVYLEVSLEAGSDISCIFVDEDEATSSDYRNVDALVILEDQGAAAVEDGTYSSSYSGSTISWCDDNSSQNVIGNLSSYVCEIVAKVTELWARVTVESTTDTNMDQAIRNADTNQSGSPDSIYADWTELQTTLVNNNNPDSNILYFAGDPDSTTDSVTLGELTVPAGAWTVVVKDANLILNGNIEYAPVSNPADYKNLPSIAFVVQGGDIYINDNALRLAGVFYTDQKFDGDERSAVDEQLTVDGSFYGNVQTLIERAKYVGPPTTDGGGIVIRYDSRILLNTPPGLSEYVDINTEKGVN
ncbi:MAG: hypothetical protein WC924_02170 [Candidatus Gracilibacteria bacterium]